MGKDDAIRFTTETSGVFLRGHSGTIDEAVLNQFRTHYPHVAFIKERDGLFIDTSKMQVDDRFKLEVDLQFKLVNPNLPLENLCNHLDNYEPRNMSQEGLVLWANRLVHSYSPNQGIGLFIFGEPGVGKTHISVALTKRFMMSGLNTVYLSPESKMATLLRYADLGNFDFQAWILDDLNSPYSQYMELFKKIVLYVHENGGVVFITSNTHYDELMEKAFVTDQKNKSRYTDRTRGMFKVLEVLGTSQREDKAWHKAYEE